MPAPYKRVYKHRAPRGKERNVICEYCKRLVPRFKAIPLYKRTIFSDPLLKDVKVLGMKRKIYICPACARFRGLSVPGRSRKSRRQK